MGDIGDKITAQRLHLAQFLHQRIEPGGDLPHFGYGPLLIAAHCEVSLHNTGGVFDKVVDRHQYQPPGDQGQDHTGDQPDKGQTDQLLDRIGLGEQPRPKRPAR